MFYLTLLFQNLELAIFWNFGSMFQPQRDNRL